MAIDMIENNELSSLSSMYKGSHPFANDRGGYDSGNFPASKKGEGPGHGGRYDARNSGRGYSNFLGIDLHGNAYHQQESEVAALERKYAPMALNTLYSLNQRNCDALNSTVKAIIDQIDTLNTQMVTMKGAFVPRIQAIIRNLVAHRDKIMAQNGSLNCPDADVKLAEQEIDTALRAAYSVPSNTDKVIRAVAIGATVLLVFFGIYKMSHKKAQ